MSQNEELKQIAATEYQFGFETQIEQETLPPGLNEGVIRQISAFKGEPEWLLEWGWAAFPNGWKMGGQGGGI